MATNGEAALQELQLVREDGRWLLEMSVYNGQMIYYGVLSTSLLEILQFATLPWIGKWLHLWKHYFGTLVLRYCFRKWIIKSPQYTGGDFMFLYRFVRRRRRRRRRRRPQILVHAITFEQLLGFLSFLAQLLALTCRLPDYIFVHFRRDLDLDFSRSNGICYISAKNGLIATKRKANIAIELWGSNVTSGFDLGHDLDLEFSRSNIEFAISQPKMVRLPRNEKQTYWLNSRPQMWPMVWIYQIVTGVTSVVGVPSTHLVIIIIITIIVIIITIVFILIFSCNK